MNRFSGDDNDRPRPEELAAFADGELDRLWREQSPPEPSEPQWTETLERIRNELDTATARPIRRRGWARIAAALTATAAMLLLGLLFISRNGPLWPSWSTPDAPLTDSAQSSATEDQRLPVASKSDVEIVSMSAVDVAVLLVGDPPVQDPLLLLTPGEITMQGFEPDRDVPQPRVHDGINLAQPGNVPQPPVSASVKEP